MTSNTFNETRTLLADCTQESVVGCIELCKRVYDTDPENNTELLFSLMEAYSIQNNVLDATTWFDVAVNGPYAYDGLSINIYAVMCVIYEQNGLNEDYYATLKDYCNKYWDNDMAGNIEIMHDLAKCYDYGKGTHSDKSLANKWYKRYIQRYTELQAGDDKQIACAKKRLRFLGVPTQT